MTSNRLEQFDIRNFTDRLTPAKGSNRYICPVCGGNNLTIDPNSTKYQCWSGCECSEIREALAPWDEISRKTYRPRNCERQRKKSRLPAPAPIPDKIELARLPELTTARPSPEKPHWIPKEVPKTALETRYWYSSTQWVSRFQWSDDFLPKGYDKTFRQGHIKPDGSFKWNKGKNSWLPYRFDEVKAQASGKWVMLLEGEECVEFSRELQLVAITLQGSSWSSKSIENALSHLKNAEVAGVIFPRDNDDVGVEKAKKVSAAAALLQFPCLVVEPTELWSNMPHKGDLADWVKWGQSQGMNQEQFIEQLERAIHAAVDGHSHLEQPPDDVESVKTVKPPKPDIIAGVIAQKYRDKWLWNDEHKTWMDYELKLKGVWTPVDDMYVSVQIDFILQSRNIKGYGESYLNNIAGILKRRLYTREWGENPNLLPFTDCVYELDTGIIREHSPGNRLTWVLPRPYNVATRSWSKIDDWLTEATQGNSQHKRILVCFAAAVLRRRADLQKFLHLIGVGGSGKSTYSNLLTALVGEENCAFPSLEELSEKDAIAELFGKVLVVFSDQDSAGRKLSQFKRLTGLDQLRGRRLFQDGFYFRFNGMCLVTSNNPIFQGGTGRWLTRRVLMIPFTKVVPDDQLRDLDKEFAPELSAFTNYLLSIPSEEIEAVLRGIGRRQKISSTLWSAQIRSDGLASWVNECLIAEPTAKTQIGSNAKEWLADDYDPFGSTLFGSYCHHCRQTNRQALTKENFSANLLELLQQTLGWGVEKKRTMHGRVITGVRLRTQHDHSLPYLDELFAKHDDHHDDPHDDPHDDLKPLSNQAYDDYDDLTNNQETNKNSQLREPLSQPSNESGQNLDEGEQEKAVIADITQSLQGDEVVRDAVIGAVSQVVIDEEIDYSTYPHLSSNDIRACQKRASACQQKMLCCTNSEQLAAFRSEGGFSSNEIDWVYRHLLNDAEKDKVHEAAHSVQLDLFETLADNSSDGPFVLDWDDLIVATDSELERLGWSTEQAVNYLKAHYGHSSRQLLSDEQMLDFIRSLRAMP